MRLLFITQKMHKSDDVLGTYHRWIEVFSKKFEKIIVICLFKGEVDLPRNVEVLSLGKEDGVSRLEYIRRFFSYIIGRRSDYDGVFVHMNIEYVLLGGLLFRLWGKKLALWYNHTYGTLLGRLSFCIPHALFHTSPFAFSAGRKKSIRMPAGIDTAFFVPRRTDSMEEEKILSIGRIAPVKRLDVLVEAAGALREKGHTVELDMYGNAAMRDGGYARALEDRGEKWKGMLALRGSVSNRSTPDLYNRYNVFVNLTPRGNFDKTVLEAASCETPVIVSSEAFSDLVLPEYLAKEGDVKSLARSLEQFFASTEHERRAYGERLRQKVIERHDLELLSKRLLTYFTT